MENERCVRKIERGREMQREEREIGREKEEGRDR